MPRSHALRFAAAAVLLAGSTAFADTTLFATLSNGAENPATVPTLSTGGSRPASFGTATLVLNSAQTQITYTITVNNIDFTGSQTPDPNDDLTAAHFHAGPAVSPTTNGGVVFGFFGAPLNDTNPNDVVITPFTNGVGGTIRGKWDAAEGNNTTLAAQLANLLNGHAYVNFHTKQFGGGELRGNIVVGPGITNGSVLSSGTQGVSYSQTLNGSGGTGPYTFTLQSGVLPSGLSLSSAGVISGTPNVVGTTTFTITTTDSANVSVNQTFSLAILASGLSFTNAVRVPHMVDGGNFVTQYAIVNLEQTPVSYRFRFWDDTGAALNAPIANGANGDIAGVLLPGAAVFAQTAGTSPSLTQGWAEVASNGRIGVTGVLRFSAAGLSDQLASVSGVQSGSNVLLPFDNAQGAVTGVAIANSNGTQPVTVTMAFTLDNNTQSSATLTLPAHGHTAFVLPTSYAATAGARGVIRFLSAGADVSVLGLRFSPNNGFVSLGSFQ